MSDRVRDQLWELVQELDESAWDLQDAEAGDESAHGYANAFARARSVNALWYAIAVPITTETVLDCLYEVQAATGDLDALRTAVSRVLTR
ncbi:hypothetical protein I6E74_09650 [Salinibacterium sp. SWN139]|uniref:hypothetical protein n=1 Tax=Salinibacterium sp. SWN139 TaxID=2792055 RepID=UPI0018CEB182|nr:hypothetical protein [Salinibacterium sp. SWN139]MBH0054433.1 hypothetical protein [Salinibacterium sp. SWN139]